MFRDAFRKKIDECKQMKMLFVAASAIKTKGPKRDNHEMHFTIRTTVPQQHPSRGDENQALLPAAKYPCHHHRR